MEQWEEKLRAGIHQVKPHLVTEMHFDEAKIDEAIEQICETIRESMLLTTMFERIFESAVDNDMPPSVAMLKQIREDMFPWITRMHALKERGYDSLAVDYLLSALALAERSQKHPNQQQHVPPHLSHRISPEAALQHYAYYCSLLADQYRQQGCDASVALSNVEQEFIELMEHLTEESEEEDERDAFMKDFYSCRPTVGMFAAHLIGANSQLKRPIQDWFDRVLSGIKRSSDGLLMFMDRLYESDSDTSLYDQFVENLHEDLIDLLSAVQNVANIFAIHAQKEDCAVLTTAMPFAASGELERECQPELNRLKSSPLYQKYSGQLCNQNFRVGDSLAIPVYVSVLDVEELSQFLGRFFMALGNKREQGDSNRPMKIRSREGAPAQFNCSLPLSHSDAFSLRIDEECHRGKRSVSLDCGSATIHDAITYAHFLAERCPEPQMIMEYSKLLNKTGGHAYMERPSDPAPRGRQHMYYPSVMECQALPMSVRVSLVLSSVLEAGRDLLLLPGETYSYHHRGRINQPQFLDAFPDIAKKLEARARTR